MHLVGKEHLDPDFLKEAEDVRVNTSSCQVYIGIKKGRVYRISVIWFLPLMLKPFPVTN